MLNGIDVSSYQKQGTINYNQYDFVMIKASEGVNFKDPALDYHLTGLFGTTNPAPQKSKCYGFYHYARPDLGNSAKDEAKSFIEFIQPQVGNCIMALDWEQKSLNYPVSWALEWLNYVYEATKVKPLFYVQASQAVLNKYKEIAKAGYGLWVAHWGADYPSFENWDFYTMWQYRGEPLDLDYFNGDKTAWKKYCEEETKEMTEEQIRKIVREEINSINNENAKKEASEWAENAIQWVLDNEVMSGDGSSFRPKSNITREETAQVIYNYFKSQIG